MSSWTELLQVEQPPLNRPLRPRSAIDRLMEQAEARMRQAEAKEDHDAWIKHYLIWLELYPLKLRLGSPFWKPQHSQSALAAGEESMDTIQALLHSRKFLIALFGVIQTIVMNYFQVDPEVWASIDAVVIVLIGAIAHEDAAEKKNPQS